MISAIRQALSQRRTTNRGVSVAPSDGSWVTTGVTGSTWRASVTPWGDLVPWGDEPALEWYIAASDRWYRPAEETAVRSERIGGTAVVETRVRIPGGDALQRISSIGDHGGMTVIEITNESSSPIAVALTRSDLLTERPVVSQPIEGIDLPEGSMVLPIGHRSSVVVALAHDGRGAGQLPGSLPSTEQVVNGWELLAERPSRLVLPDGRYGSAIWSKVVSQRCELALVGPADQRDDPAAFLLGLEEMSRLGESMEPWLPDVVAAVAAVSRESGWMVDRALEAAGRLLMRAGEGRAVADLDAMLQHRIESGAAGASADVEPPDGVGVIAWIESRLAHRGMILPGGFHEAWLGADFEVHGVAVGDGDQRLATVGYAIRWHGARPAFIYEVSDGPVQLSAPVVAPEWSSAAVSAEALWPEPVIDRSFS